MSETSPHSRFPHLFQPFILKGVTLRNRVAVSAHFAGWWVDNGLPSRAFADYLEERAKGGTGLFVIGATSPEPGSGWMENLSDAIIPRYRMLVEAGHRHGTAVFAQLCHPGFRPLPGTPIIAPPPGRKDAPSSNAVKPEPTRDDLHRLVRAFGDAAGRAAQGGVDGLELHSHESFLHAQFLNPLWNTRSDEYGGSLENRMRFLIETLQAMRAAIGPDLPLGVRLKLDDMAQRGMSAEEYQIAVQRLEALELVDYLNVTGGDGRFHHGPMPRPEGEWIPLVGQLRAGTRLTLMHAGRISTPEMAEQALALNAVDVVCMTKTHICDPHFTRKVFENRLDDIRYCTRCLQSCHGKMHEMTCVYNPVTSREAEWATLQPAAPKRRVVIVGGGPAGMEAALVASGRGHDVTVIERNWRVGGQVWYGAASPMRRNWRRIGEFYDRQSRKGEFRILLNCGATVENVLGFQPDVVVIATGSRPKRLEIPGGPSAMTVHEALEGKADNARHVVLFDEERGNRPLVAADYLSSRAIEVDFITSFPEVGRGVEGMMLEEMAVRLEERGVRFSGRETLVGWEGERRLRVRDVETADERILDGVDAVVATIGSDSVSDLAEQLRGRVGVHVIGDASEPRTVEAATYEGGRIGRLL